MVTTRQQKSYSVWLECVLRKITLSGESDHSMLEGSTARTGRFER